MTRSLDPTIVHEGECETCGTWVRDNETLSMDGDCLACVSEAEEDETLGVKPTPSKGG